MTQREALVGLNLAGEIGSVRLKRLLDFFGSAHTVLKASYSELMQVSGIGETLARNISSLKPQVIFQELELAGRCGVKIVTMYDDSYPQLLKVIPGPPIVLYVKGALKEEDGLSVAIVGSRRASFYGLESAQKFAAALAERGFTVVSGLARGIDTASHKGALARGRTLAVMGSGFNHIYPPENKALIEKICACGAVISEFPLGTKPLKQNFPRRNRLISGLSLGVLVVEAAKNSGALITADFALEQGREVFALPGRFDSETSGGTHALIKQGAKLVLSVEDILEEFPCCASYHAARNASATVSDEPPVSLEEARVFEYIGSRAATLDTLVEKTRLDIPEISSILLRLQIKKLVQELPGKQFVRKTHER